MTALVIENALQGLVGLLWVAGLDAFAGPLDSRTRARMLGWALVLPLAASVARRLSSGLPEGLTIVRARAWAAALDTSGLGVHIVVGGLLLGTTLIFLVQELAPLLWRLRRPEPVSRAAEPEVQALLARTLESFAVQGALWKSGSLELRVIDTGDPFASLRGIGQPVMFVSRGLLERLDPEELQAALAHEVAHLAAGGNLRTLLVWLARAVQATSPAALVLFRSLMEAEEQACDALATRITEDPAALASALLRVHQLTPHGAGDDAGIHARARAAVLERGQEASIRRRVTALLDRSPPEEVPRLAQVVAAGALLAMLWAVA